MIQLAAVAFVVIVASATLVFWATVCLRRLSARTIVALALVASCLYAGLLASGSRSAPFGSLAVVVVAALVGSCIGLLLTTRAALVSFCIVAAIADVVSSTAGATAQLSQAHRQGTSHLFQALSVSVPIGGSVRPIVGIGDLIILGAVYFTLARLGIRGAAAFLAPLAGLLGALGVGLAVGGVFAIPFIAAGTLALLWLEGRRRASEGPASGG